MRHDTIRQLQSDRHIYGRCPSCAADFPLRKALLFYSDEPPPETVRTKVRAMREDLRERERLLRERRKQAQRGSERLTIDVNLGKILERIAPIMDGFGHNPRDCRALFDPIDYVVFNGLSRLGEVESLTFVDIKTGGGSLNTHQRQIRDALEARKLEWQEYSWRGRSS